MTTLFALAVAAVILWGCFMFLRWCCRMAVSAQRDIEAVDARIRAARGPIERGTTSMADENLADTVIFRYTDMLAPTDYAIPERKPMADVDTGTAPLYREVLRRLLNPPEPVTIGMGYVSLDLVPDPDVDDKRRDELCLDVTIVVTRQEAEALQELMEHP